MTIEFKAVITDIGNSPFKIDDELHIRYPEIDSEADELGSMNVHPVGSENGQFRFDFQRRGGGLET